VAEVELRGPRENATPITELPRILREHLTIHGELVAIEQALAAAGVDEGGTAGVAALQQLLTDERLKYRAAQREYEAQGAGWSETSAELDAALQRVGAVRTLLGQWGGRDLTDGQLTLYRELTGVLMARAPASGAPSDTEGTGQQDDAHTNEGEAQW
jgi:hypothetical protein